MHLFSKDFGAAGCQERQAAPAAFFDVHFSSKTGCCYRYLPCGSAAKYL